MSTTTDGAPGGTATDAATGPATGPAGVVAPAPPEPGAPETPPTPTTRLLHDIAEEAPLRDPVRRRRLLLTAGIAVVVLALVVGAMRLFGGNAEEERDAAAIEKVQERVLPALEDLLGSRETFLAAERDYLTATKQAKAAVTRHNRQGTALRLGPQRAVLERVASQMNDLRTTLADVEAPPITADAEDYLLSAVGTLARNAAGNAAALRRAGAGKVRLVAVNDDNALPAIRKMNKSLLFVLDAARLPVTDFDLPGGTDKDKGDHSTSM
ncbi:hypothetical protein KIH74_10650 [Kineosporia sp. J2-2]|uniref:DUF5667 domain-containing protein n=1 Tax=Kineosporia corallincola TaxID=2835133 RepID=A0ABS5TE80_9ACTN|nr:hypothetical protein [Kineosporia corallincola]MBT0769380.1 hypothetical protein [Kineosporia corallincola]